MRFEVRNVAFCPVPFWESGVQFDDAARLCGAGAEPRLPPPLARNNYFFFVMLQIWSEWMFKPMFVKL